MFILLVALVLAKITPPLTTKGQAVVDSNGKNVRLACVNWYGAHMERYVVNGADQQSLGYIARKIASLGFNCVRLPFSIEMYVKNRKPAASALTHNSWLYGKTAAEVYDATVQALTDAGIMVILNNHISDARWCCSCDDGNGLWWTPTYKTDIFEDTLLQVTQRYLSNPLVVGFDLRNELRCVTIDGVAVQAMWNQGVSFGKRLDWHDESQQIGNKILQVNPHMLIIVEGVSYAGVFRRPLAKAVNLTVSNQLIYSGHMYQWFGCPNDYSGFASCMHDRLTWISKRDNVPFWLGEFGTAGGSSYWNNIVKFLQENPNIGWALWAIDGYQRPGLSESYGLLNYQYNGVKKQWQLNMLKSVMGPKPNPTACCLDIHTNDCIDDDWCNASKDRCLGPCDKYKDKKWGPPPEMKYWNVTTPIQSFSPEEEKRLRGYS